MFWRELNRRKVTRVAIAYLVGAWAILQRDEAMAEADGYAVEKKVFKDSLAYLFVLFGALMAQALLDASPLGATVLGGW